MTSSVGWVRLAVACFMVLATWPTPGSAADQGAKPVADDWCGFSMAVGEPWRRAPLRGYNVPGAARCAWSGPKGSSIVVFLQEPGLAVSPRAMLDSSTGSLKDKLGAAVSAQEVRAVSGMQAMWMVVTAKGNGGAIDGKGDVATTQHWVAVPRERDVVVALLTCPAADYPELRKSFEAATDSLKLSGSQTAEQKAAK